jgi:hypothetical protein
MSPARTRARASDTVSISEVPRIFVPKFDDKCWKDLLQFRIDEIIV